MKQKIIFFKNLFWEILGKGINIGSIFIINFSLANYLGPDQYGSYSYIVTFCSLFLFLSEFGLERIEIRETVTGKKIIETSLLLRGLASIFAYALLVLVAYFSQENSSSFYLIIIFAISNFASVNYTFRNFFFGKFKNIYSTIALNLKDIFSLLSKLYLISIGASLETILYFSIIDFFIESIALVIIFKIKFKDYQLNYDFSHWKFLINKSFPLLISGLLILIYKKVDLLIINHYLTDFETGIYSSAQKISNAVLTGTIVVLMVLGPLINKSISSPQYTKKRMLFFEVIIAVTILLSIPFFIFSEQIVQLILSPEYKASETPLKILIIKNIFESMFLATGYIIIIEDLQKKAYLRNLIAGVFSLSANFIFIPIFGIIGAAYVSLVTYFFAAFFSNYIVKEYRFLIKITISALLFKELRKYKIYGK